MPRPSIVALQRHDAEAENAMIEQFRRERLAAEVTGIRVPEPFLLNKTPPKRGFAVVKRSCWRSCYYFFGRILSLVTQYGVAGAGNVAYLALLTYRELPKIAPLATPSRLSGSVMVSTSVPER